MKLKAAFDAFKRNFASQATIAAALACVFVNQDPVEGLSFKPKVCGKIDGGAVYAHVDVLESGHTVHKMDLGGFKGDATISLIEGCGLVLKPSVMLTGSDNGYLFVEGIAVGHYTPMPFCKQLALTPYVGVQWTQLKTHFDVAALGLEHIHESFHSISPYLALELTYTFCEKYRICLMYQYSWSRTHTTIKWPEDFLASPVVQFLGPDSFKRNFKSNTEGPNYAGMLEYDVTKQWSVNIGAAYNISLSKEKHGLRGYGVKLGTAYWF